MSYAPVALTDDNETTTAADISSMTVIVISIKDWLSGRGKKVSTRRRQPRRRAEVDDSTLARLQPEVEPPMGFLALVFSDVR